MPGLIGKKIGMTSIFDKDGKNIPCTVIQAGPCTVTQVKTVETDGYAAVQIGFDELSEAKQRNVTKPLQKHFGEQKLTRHLKEFVVEDIAAVEVGQSFDVTIFEVGQKVDCSGTSKGKGFAGAMKRHNFKGGPGSHGHRFNRGTGSIGQSATPAKVFKGKKMPGQYGNERVTVMNLEVMQIDTDLNVVLVKGNVPGPTGGLIEIRKAAKG